MNAQQLHFIRQLQKQYEDKFGEKLHIDMLRMKGVQIRVTTHSVKGLENCVRELEKKHGVKLDTIRKLKRTIGFHRQKERAFLADFCIAILENRWNTGKAMEYIGRDRSTFYYYKTNRYKKLKQYNDL